MKSSRNLVAIVICCLILAGCASLEETRQVDSVQKASAFAPEKLVIADFNNGMKPNNLGGDYGAWDKDPADTTQFCEAEFSSDEKTGDSGYAMKLVYDVDSPSPAYNGFWMKLEESDLTPYETLTVSIKGDTDKGFTNKIVIELKNMQSQVGKVLLPVTGEWQEKTIPLSSFSGVKDFSSMTEFVVVFDDANSNPKTGAIYIDNIHVNK